MFTSLAHYYPGARPANPVWGEKRWLRPWFPLPGAEVLVHHPPRAIIAAQDQGAATVAGGRCAVDLAGPFKPEDADSGVLGLDEPGHVDLAVVIVRDRIEVDLHSRRDRSLAEMGRSVTPEIDRVLGDAIHGRIEVFRPHGCDKVIDGIARGHLAFSFIDCGDDIAAAD